MLLEEGCGLSAEDGGGGGDNGDVEGRGSGPSGGECIGSREGRVRMTERESVSDPVVGCRSQLLRWAEGEGQCKERGSSAALTVSTPASHAHSIQARSRRSSLRLIAISIRPQRSINH